MRVCDPHVSYDDRPQRPQTVGEVLVEGASYNAGPSLLAAMELLCKLAYTSESRDVLAAKAKAFITQSAMAFVDLNEDEE